MQQDFPNIRHLFIFKEVARAGGISAAASRVHLSQPAVTQAVARLEDRFGKRLFHRRTTGMFLTREGAVVEARIARMFGHLKTGARDAARRAGARASTPRTGPAPGFFTRVTPAQLRALVAIANAGSFSLAARATGLSQPSIHRAARQLERLAGISFFAQGPRGTELTPAAEPFLRAVKLAAAELVQAQGELSRLAGQDTTRITIGSMPLSRSQILPGAIDAMLREAPGIQLRAVDGPYPELLRALRCGEIDMLIGATRDPAPADDVVQEVLFHDPLAIVAGPGHPLVGRRGLGRRDVLGFPWVAPPIDTPAGKFLYRWLDISALDRTPVRVVSSSMVLVRGLLARGDYLSILSPHQAALERAKGLIVPLDLALTDSARPIGLTTRAGWAPTRTQTRFLDLVREAAPGPRTSDPGSCG